MSSTKWQRVVACACMALAAVFIAACGSSSKSSSSGTTSAAAAGTSSTSGSSSGSSGGSAGASATAADEKTPSTIGITVPLKSKPPTGKVIDFLRCSQPVCAGYLQGLTPAAKALGWTLKSVTFQPTPEAEVAAIEQAVRTKPAGIYVTGLDQAVIASALAQAKAAKVPVVDGYDLNTVTPPIIANVANGTANNFAPQAAADYIASDSKCSGDTAVYNIKTYPILDYTTKRLIPALKKLCPSMKVTEVDVQATDVGTKIPSEVTSTLQQNPNTKYVAFAFGDMALGVPAAMKSAGVNAKIVGFGAGGPTNVQNVAGGSEAAETAYGITYGAWRAMDAFARYDEGMSVKIDTTAPNPGELFVKSNAGSVKGWTTMAVAPDMPQQFEKLWHLG